MNRVPVGLPSDVIGVPAKRVAALVSVRDLDRIVELDRKSVRQKELEYLMRADAWERAKKGEPGMVKR